MLRSGNTELELKRPYRVDIQADGPFTATIQKDKHAQIIGPFNENDRRLTVEIKDVPAKLVVKCLKKVHWTADLKQIRGPGDPVDPIPIEVPEEYQKPLSLKEEMKRFIVEEMAASQQGAGSFDEEDDFEIEDEEEWQSPV